MDYKLHGPGRNPSPAIYKPHLLEHVSSLICKILIFGADMWLVYIIWLSCYSSKRKLMKELQTIFLTQTTFMLPIGWSMFGPWAGTGLNLNLEFNPLSKLLIESSAVKRDQS